MADLTPIDRTWTSRPPEKLEDVDAFIAREGLPLWRQMRELINSLISVSGGLMNHLTVTSVKASDYTAKIEELVLVDSSGGGTVNITIPTGSASNSGRFVGLVRMSTLGTVNLLSGSDIDGAGTSLLIPAQVGLYLFVSEGA